MPGVGVLDVPGFVAHPLAFSVALAMNLPVLSTSRALE